MKLIPWPADLFAEVSAGRLQRVSLEDTARLAAIAPPSAEAVVEVLDNLPNPLETTRDEWLAVMMAARGCIQALEGLGNLTPEGQEAIEEAVFAWCERWPAAQEDDPRDKWENDISTRDAPLAGWPTLERIARRTDPEFREKQAADEFGALAAEAPTDQGSLLDALDAQTWADMDLPPTRQYLGAVLQTATRLNLVGSTGLGKTQIAHAMAAGIASGHGFGPWAGSAPARVLVLDGEMSTRLLKARMASAIKRHGHPIPKGNLVVYAVDRGDVLKQQFPWLGDFASLNTEAGLAFLQRLIGEVQPEVIFFDNVMSLMMGDQKDEVTWSAALTLMGWITRQRIAQVWLDHTTHTANRQYGSVTKMWRADAVGVMSAVDKKERVDGEVKFTLTFSAPEGKARERDENNWRDFADRTFIMGANGWQVSDAKVAKPLEADPRTSLPKATREWYDALLKSCTDGHTTRALWLEMGVEMGLAKRLTGRMSKAEGDNRTAPMRRALTALEKAGLIRIEEGNKSDVWLTGSEADELGALG